MIYVNLDNPEAVTKLRPGYKIHTLLYGLPGGGKTEFARIIVERSNCPCFIVDPKNTLTELAEVFSQAKSCEKAIIFIDEFDSFASYPDAAKLIQTEMDGFDKPKHTLVIIAATNYLEKIAPAVRSRFGKKIEVLLPSEKQRAEFFKFSLNDLRKRAPNIFDDSLNDEIRNGCINLGRDTENFSIRDMNLLLDELTPFLVDRLNESDSTKESLMVILSNIISKVKSSVDIEHNLFLATNPSLAYNPSRLFSPSILKSGISESANSTYLLNKSK